jgi:lipopolysaccharide/colanic/teichoic acid biosynthesis glycosyltransferase
MKTETDFVLPTHKHSKNVVVNIAVLEQKSGSQTDFINDNWHLFYISLESLSFAVLDKSITIDAVFIGPDSHTGQMQNLSELLKKHNIPFVLYSSKYNETFKQKAIELRVDDYLVGAFTELMIKRINFIKKAKIRANSIVLQPTRSIEPMNSIKIWRLKRVSDIILSSLAIILLTPLLLTIALVIKVESRGPIFYVSKRAGSGYKIFNFYKFRSMRVGADKELKSYSHLNQYSDSTDDSIFFKLKDDPRVTRFGSFLRNSSLDELPQLLNVLKGDMSLVGNRPLPLYEAERLTKDQIAWRFLAPAGITGLWQVTKRGNKEMSLDERIHLDMEYAMKNSFLLDMKIILATFPALIQKEKV